MFCNSRILGIPLPSVLVLQYREETSLRYVVMVAKFLDDNKRENSLKVNSHCFKLHRSYSIQMLAKFSRLSSKEPYLSLEKEKETFCVSFTYSVKRARENRKFHVVVDQG